MYGYDFQPTPQRQQGNDPFDEILRFAERQGNRGVNNAPPTSPLAIEELDIIHFDSQRTLGRYLDPCVVCSEAWKLGDEAKKLPCKHTFHEDCIIPWLTVHNTCPMCRYTLPTLDPVYEAHKSEKTQNQDFDEQVASYANSMYIEP